LLGLRLKRGWGNRIDFVSNFLSFVKIKNIAL